MEANTNRRLAVLTAINFAAILLLIGLETFIAERYWLATLITYAPQHFFGIPTVILLIWSLCRKNRKLIALNGAAAMFFTFALMGFNIPLHRSSGNGGVRIRVMTFNVRQAARGAAGLAQVIRKYHPDILCVQEVNNAHDEWGDPVAQIVQLIPGWQVVRDGDAAVLTRYPITRRYLRYLPPRTQRSIIGAELDVRGRRITVLTTHFQVASRAESLRHRRSSLPVYLGDAASIRLAQKNTLLGFAASFETPIIITGDLNTPALGLTYRGLVARYTDAFRAAGWGFGHTFRSDRPYTRIDYILVDKRFCVARCFVPNSRASDHRPVVADIAIR